MKRLLCFALILAASSSFFAQERTITKERFDVTFKRGLARTAGKSHRITRTVEYTVEGRSPYSASTKEVTEIVPPNMTHSITEISSKSGTERKETIQIGSKTYLRDGNEEWKEAPTYTSKDNEKWNELNEKDKPKTVTHSLDIISDEKEYKLFGYENWNNQRVAVAGFVQQLKTINSANKAETVSITTYKCWFDGNDGLLKTETYTKSQSGEVVTHNRKTEVYDLDPNIKIEAPIQ